MAAFTMTLTCVVTVFVVMHWSGALAQSDCTSSLLALSPCLNYVSGNSSRPSSSCCLQLANVVKSKPRCLCLMLNGGASSSGVNINQTLALELPDACGVQTPPASRCNAGNGATPSAAAAPPPDSSNGKSATPTTPSISDTPAGIGTKTAPTIDGSSSAGVKSFQLLSFLPFIAYYALFPSGF